MFVLTTTSHHLSLKYRCPIKIITKLGTFIFKYPGLDHIFIQLGLAPSHISFITHVIITNIQVDMTFHILKLIDGAPLHAKGA
jgi:hypothetical protein